MILDEIIELLKLKYSDEFNSIEIEDIRVGVFLTAVKLSNNLFGVSSTFTDGNHQCKKRDRDFGDFTPLKIKGQKVSKLFVDNNQTKFKECIKLATINALSSKFLTSDNYRIIEEKDPVEFIDLTKNQTITIVGAFHSYINKIAETDNKLFVLELEENKLNEEQNKFYIPACDAHKVIPISDVVIITGFTLVNNTIDDLLKLIPEKCQVIVAGPTSSIIPDLLFKKKVNIIGSSKIYNGEMLLDAVSQAATGFHLFKYCSKKICILNE